MHSNSTTKTTLQRCLIIPMYTQAVTGRVIHTVFPDACYLSLRLDKKAMIGEIKTFSDFKGTANCRNVVVTR